MNPYNNLEKYKHISLPNVIRHVTALAFALKRCDIKYYSGKKSPLNDNQYDMIYRKFKDVMNYVNRNYELYLKLNKEYNEIDNTPNKSDIQNLITILDDMNINLCGIDNPISIKEKIKELHKLETNDEKIKEITSLKLKISLGFDLFTDIGMLNKYMITPGNSNNDF